MRPELLNSREREPDGKGEDRKKKSDDADMQTRRRMTRSRAPLEISMWRFFPSSRELKSERHVEAGKWTLSKCQMCYRTACTECGRPTWAGCGKHIESALAGVPEDERCHCREDKLAAAATQQAEAPNEKLEVEPVVTQYESVDPVLDQEKANQSSQSGDETIALLHTLTGHTDRVWNIAIHPTVPLIATASADKTVRLYSTTSYQHVGTIEGNHKRSIRSCSWKPGEPKPVLATGSFDGTAGIWDSQKDDETGEDEWECAGLLEGHENEVKSVAWSASGTLLATCSRDKSIWVWECENYEDPECVSVMQEHAGDVKCVAWHSTEELLASGSYDDEIRMWRDDGDDWICCAVLKGHDGTVWAIDFSPATTINDDDDSATAKTQLVSASGDSTVRIWTRTVDRASGKRGPDEVPSIIRPNTNQEWTQSAVLPAAHQGDIYTVSWSASSGRIASGGEDGNIIIYKRKQIATNMTAEDGEEPWVIECEKVSAHGVYEINHLVWGPRQDDGSELLFSAGDDGEVRVWRVKQST